MNVPEVSSGNPPGTSLHVEASEQPDRAWRPTDPKPSSLLLAHRAEIQGRPRNRSPYSRSHLRSYSAAGALAAPPMARTRSLPNPAGGPSISPSHSPVRPSSPLRAPAATRPSPRRSFDDSHQQGSVPSFMEIESIAEDSELNITPRPRHQSDISPSLTAVPFSPSPSNARPSSSGGGRRRPNSPLHSLVPSPAPSPSPLSFHSGSSPFSVQGSPSMQHQPSPSTTPPPSRYNETYPGSFPTATSHPNLTLSTQTAQSNSSIPSTPTSLRSRSPSISSLETIPDSPDAEEAAMEAFNIARLKAAAEAAESLGSDSDGEGGGGVAVGTNRARTSAGGRGSGLGGNAPSTEKSRKRWSVCGAERRGDFEMETIWED